MNKLKNTFEKVFKKHKDVSIMFLILSFVLYINIFHCNDFSRILVSIILLFFLYNSFFKDKYLSLGFSVASIVIIELLQFRNFENFENESTNNTKNTKNTKDNKNSDNAEKKMKDKSTLSSLLEKHSSNNTIDANTSKDIGELTTSDLTDINSDYDIKQKESFGGMPMNELPADVQVQKLEDVINTITKMQLAVDKLTPTINKGMDVMKKIENIGFSK